MSLLRRRPFCAEVSAESGEPVSATASRIDHWILVEYRGQWARRPVEGSSLSPEVKEHLAGLVAARRRTRLLFVRRPDRRRAPGLVCFFGSTPERGGAFTRVEVERYEDLLEAGAGEPVDGPLLVVCTHGKRDRCCAKWGRPLYDALADQCDPGSVWQATHVGGDRFAGNVIAFPQGLYFGRVGAEDAWSLLDDLLAGRIDLDRYRGRCCYPFAVQAAEDAVRRSAGLTGIDDLTLVSAEGGRVVLEAEGRRYETEVRTELGELSYLTCSSDRLERPRRFVAELVDES